MAGTTEKLVKQTGWNPSGQLLENLSITEHMRWCAFHYSMGFEPMSTQTHLERAKQYIEDVKTNGSSNLRITRDLRTLQHACLIPWEELDSLSERENSITGGKVDYKQHDRLNILAMEKLLSADKIEEN